jgi:hypothetical protein
MTTETLVDYVSKTPPSADFAAGLIVCKTAHVLSAHVEGRGKNWETLTIPIQPPDQNLARTRKTSLFLNSNAIQH